MLCFLMTVKGVSSSHCASGQVWGMALLSEEKRLITGSGDSELRAWDLTYIQEVRHSLCNPSAPCPAACLSTEMELEHVHIWWMSGKQPKQCLCYLRGPEALVFPVFWAFKWSWDFYSVSDLLPSDLQLRKAVLWVDDNHGSMGSAWCLQECCRTLQCMLTSCVSREI